MQTDKNIKLVRKRCYEIVKIKDKLLKKGRLFAAKVKNGYCLFQDAGETRVYIDKTKLTYEGAAKTLKSLYGKPNLHIIHYVIFYERVLSEIPKNFDFLNDEKYFYRQIDPKEGLKFMTGLKDGFLQFPYDGHPYSVFFEGRITYSDLGLQKLPATVSAQRYFRDFDGSLLGKKKLYLHDVFNGELFEYKHETVEYLQYSPDFGTIEPTLMSLEDGFTLEKWNLEWLKKGVEEYFLEHPSERPMNETYDELRVKLPTKEYVKFIENVEMLEANTRVEAALIAFADGLVDEDNLKVAKAKKLTKELVLKLNKINEETDFIETVEREEIHAYIEKLLIKLNKKSAIDVIDVFREW